MRHRQARLLAPFSQHYARITPGRWHHAGWLREVALADLRSVEVWPPELLEPGRVLCDAHFEFQGGLAANPFRGVERRMMRLAP